MTLESFGHAYRASPGSFLRQTRRVRRRRTPLPPRDNPRPEGNLPGRSTPLHTCPPARPKNLAPKAPLHRTSPSPSQSAASAIPSEPTRRPNSFAAPTTPPPQQPAAKTASLPESFGKSIPTTTLAILRLTYYAYRSMVDRPSWKQGWSSLKSQRLQV